VQSRETNWFFVGHLPAATAEAIVFGDEGQRWSMMSDDSYITQENAVPKFQDRLKLYLEREC
jgi:8-oxo-dGTP diphosphatase